MTTTMTVPNLEALKNLVEQDAALQKDLGSSSSRQEFTNKLATAALAKGLVIDETELGNAMDVAFDQYTENPELTDEQLENVAGGGLGLAVGLVAIITIVSTAGTVAAIASTLSKKR